MKSSRRAQTNRRYYILAAMIIASVLLVFILGSLSIPTSAKEIGPRIEQNYESIEIQSGDSLWSIAETYAQTLNMDTADYVETLKEVNGLKSDKLVTGTYLIIIYGSIAA